MAESNILDFHRPPFVKLTTGSVAKISGWEKHQKTMPTPPFTTSVAFYQANAEAFIVASVRDIGKREAMRIVEEMRRAIAGKP